MDARRAGGPDTGEDQRRGDGRGSPTTKSSILPPWPATPAGVVRLHRVHALDADETWERSKVVPGEEILARINAVWPLEPASERALDAAPADRYRVRRRLRRDRCHHERDPRGSVAHATASGSPRDGAIRNCCVRPMRSTLCGTFCDRGGSDADLALLVRQAVWAKRAGHGINDPAFLRPARSMSMIGGLTRAWRRTSRPVVRLCLKSR